MDGEYIHSFNHNYLKWKVLPEADKKLRYQYQIITTKKLDGLLATNLYTTDGETSLYYEISAMQSLEKWFTKEKISRKWIEKIIEGVKMVLYSLKEYLLDGRNLLANPAYIFVNMESEKICFAYFPYYIEERQQDMESFLSFLIDNIREEESETLEVLYDMYARWEVGRELFTWETFLALWEKKKPAAESEEKAAPETDFSEEGENAGKKEITDFLFGRRRITGKRVAKEYVAAENWEYKGEAVKENEDAVKEERKLYGNGKQNRRVLRLKELPAIVGKKEEVADIVLQDASIGIMHARFTEENGQVYLEDLNTEQGTYKNSVRLKPYEKVEILREDEIKMGKLEFTYR